MPRTSIRIHHLSDIHYGDAHYRPEDKIGVVPMPDFRNATAYLNHMAGLAIDRFPNLVVISGDFATRATEQEMDLAEKFVTRISELPQWNERRNFPQDSPRVLIVPGNHDLDWQREKADEKHERFGKFSNLVDAEHFVLSSWYKRKPRLPWHDFGDETNLFVYLLNSTPCGGAKDAVLEQIHKAISDSNGHLGLDANVVKSLVHHIRKDPGFVPDEDIAKMKQQAASIPTSRIKIAVVHHNPNHMPSDDRDVFDTIVNGGTLKAALLRAGFHLVLHGHRHMFHCSAEWHPGTPYNEHQCYFVGADSLGCKEDAPFLEVTLSSNQTEGYLSQAAILSIQEFHYSPAGYRPATSIEAPLIPSDIQVVGRTILEGSVKSAPDAVRRAIVRTCSEINNTSSNTTQWAQDAQWIRQFHIQMDVYSRIWATSLYDSKTLLNPVYQRYLRDQYTERFKRLRDIKEKTLYYSPDVLRATALRSWEPLPELWGDYERKRAANSGPSSLEVCRIVILDRAEIDLAALENLAYDHALCAIPLFVLEKRHLQTDPCDFALGLNAEGNPVKGYALDEKSGLVTEQTRSIQFELMAAFEGMLQSQHLKTAQAFIGQQRMYGLRAVELTKKYAAARKSSRQIIEILTKHLPSNADIGVDLCCGSGNYIAPFKDRFRKVIGIDSSPEMIEEAKKRVANAECIVCDAKDTKCQSSFCDAIWMISALHYFPGEEQQILLNEVSRILKPGATFIADTEFLEQHLSLWIVDYFPSLKRRYKNALFTREQYTTMLKDAGFGEISFETHEYGPNEVDAFLRIGQNAPARYLDQAIRDGIPAFQTMDPAERKRGLERLKTEIDTGETARIIQRYRSQATLPGDLGIIVAKKRV